ncbi:MAG TPA: hypothetical protein VKO85_03480 [Wenzhouxiangellaceae bacterium]|nr:hypothetical protein [Wenzhouxiangellaceae bacterium]
MARHGEATNSTLGREQIIYNVSHLLKVAREGLADMAPALRRAFNKSRDDDRLDRVFGPKPRAAIAAVIVGGIVLGRWLESIFGPGLITDNLDLSAVLIGAIYAMLIRKYLFSSGHARRADFPWLAASLIPTAAALVLVAFIENTASGNLETIRGAPLWTDFGAVADALADSLAVAAGLTIAVAALCFSENWTRALRDLATQLLVFKILVFVMVLLIVEIGIVGPILAAILKLVLGISIPDWVGEFADQLTYAALISVIYFAVIGATWMVCRKTFAQLLETGDAEILKSIKAMSESPAKQEKRKLKELAQADSEAPARAGPPESAQTAQDKKP